MIKVPQPSHAPHPCLTFPEPVPPAPGTLLEIAPGIVWFRLALPFLLDHVNIYLIEDGNGWTLVDTGLGDAATARAWEALLAGAPPGRPLPRLTPPPLLPRHVAAAPSHA